MRQPLPSSGSRARPRTPKDDVRSGVAGGRRSERSTAEEADVRSSAYSAQCIQQSTTHFNKIGQYCQLVIYCSYCFVMTLNIISFLSNKVKFLTQKNRLRPYKQMCLSYSSGFGLIHLYHKK